MISIVSTTTPFIAAVTAIWCVQILLEQRRMHGETNASSNLLSTLALPAKTLFEALVIVLAVHICMVGFSALAVGQIPGTNAHIGINAFMTRDASHALIDAFVMALTASIVSGSYTFIGMTSDRPESVVLSTDIHAIVLATAGFILLQTIIIATNI